MVFLTEYTPVDRRYLVTMDQSPQRVQLELLVRSEAIAAGRRQGRNGIQIPEAVLNFIVATSDWSMSREQLSARAVQIAEHYADNQPPFNLHSATREQIYNYFAGMGRRFGMGRLSEEDLRALAGSGRDGGSSALPTSARFDAFSGTDGAYLAAMRSYAIENGLAWAADRPEILRLGREAIELFARLGFSRQSHDRLHEAGFNHHQMVHIARFVERTGLGPAAARLGCA